MFQQFYAGLMFALGLLSPRRDAQIQFLLLQIKMLKGRLNSDRVVPTPEEKAELLRLGGTLQDDISDIIAIVKPETYRKWCVQSRDGKVAKRPGPAGLAKEIKELICRLAKENVQWGYRRIVGELKKLGHTVATSSVKRVVSAHDLHPSPTKSGPTPPMPWTKFVHAHMESLVACDFFTKPIYTLFGRFEAYVLVFIHIGSRKVYCSRPTKNPDSEWVMQQARNASMWLADEGVKPQYLIRDGDRKFPDTFKEFWKAEDVRVIRIPPKSPRANAFCECFVGTIKKECLNFFMCFSLDQLHYIVKIWVGHYNTVRPHRGIGMQNNVLDEQFKPQREGPVRCREKLGGLIREYYREAASKYRQHAEIPLILSVFGITLRSSTQAVSLQANRMPTPASGRTNIEIESSGRNTMKNFRAAVCQIMFASDRSKNLKKAKEMIGEAAAKKANLIVLGEMFNCPYQNKFFQRFAEDVPGGETYEMLRKSAMENQVYVIGGSIPERAGDAIYNTSCIFDPKGELIAKHRKMHLFDVELETITFKESDTLSRGSELTVFDTEYGRLGTAICYDIRFPELMRLMALDGAEVIIIPAAFNMTTGPAHWELLFRTRALDNQVYMIGASPARDVNGVYVAYGNSIIATPWGDVVARAGEGEEIIYADLDGSALTKVRAELPLLKHRRTDIYEIIRK